MLDNLFVSEEVQQYRYKICEGCENFTTLKFCSKCNCFMPVKTKLPYKKCPIDLWDRITIENKNGSIQ